MHLSGLYEEESWFLQGSRVLDFRTLEGTNCYCSPAAAEELRSAIRDIGPQGIHWIDTGDYHYLSLLWMELISEPFCLALFDNHPDDQGGAFDEGMLSCGNWVKAARESLPNLKKDFLNVSDLPDGLPVYLSIDLDVLTRQYARTDWDQGQMALSELVSDIGRIAAGHRIIGADVCGGLTVGKGASEEDLRINFRTRRVLQDCLSFLQPASAA